MTGSSLAGRVRELRVAAGLSQEQLAGEGLSASYISLIESGGRSPSRKAAQQLADRLGVDVEYLLTGRSNDGRQTKLSLTFADLALKNGDAQEAERQARLILANSDAGTSRHDVYWVLAGALEAQGKLEQAIAVLEEIAQVQDGGQVDVSWLRVVVALSRCYREAGDLAHAVDVAERALERANREGLTGTDAEVELVSTLAFGHLERGDLNRAKALLQRALSLVENGGSRRARGAAYWNLSILAMERQDLPLAMDLAERAHMLFAEDDDIRSLGRLRNVLGALYLRSQPPQPEAGRELLTQARAILVESGSRVDTAYCDTELARAHLLIGDAAQAIDAARSALAALDPDSLEAGRALLTTAEAWHMVGDEVASRSARQMAAATLQRAGAHRQSARAWAELAAHYESCGDLQAAVDAHKQAGALLGLAPGAPTVYAVDASEPSVQPTALREEDASRSPSLR